MVTSRKSIYWISHTSFSMCSSHCHPKIDQIDITQHIIWNRLYLLNLWLVPYYLHFTHKFSSLLFPEFSFYPQLSPKATTRVLVPATPMAQIRAAAPDTVQRSILRQASSSVKRRKVAFISPTRSAERKKPLPTPSRLDSSLYDSESSVDLEIDVSL